MDKLDEGKLVEIQQTNTAVMAQAEEAVVALEAVIKQKKFGPESDGLMETVSHHGKEVARRLEWWNKEFIGPVVNGAYIHWKELCQRRDMIADPLEKKKVRAALAVGAYRTGRDEFKRAEEEKINRERMKKAEDERLEKAQALQDSGRKEEADEVLEEPIYTPPAILPGAPEVQGTSIRRNWKYRITDPNKIPREFMTPDMTKIGMQVRTTKERTNIPGVEVYSEDKAGFSVRS
jgi:hypothetical protein